jgi:LDH2 family malate/lactate/ureidoglycolate dehydrogenase
MADFQIFTHSHLQKFVSNVFSAIGCSTQQAQQAAEVLITADLRGIDSHGVARLAGYVKQWELKKLNPLAQAKIIHETPSTAVLDGDRGLGLVNATTAMEIAIQKAQQVGSGWVAVKNSGHFGIAGYHAMKALEHDMIGIVMTHASALAVPTFAIEKMLGTNPIAVAIPAAKFPPFVADFATTAAAYGKLQILQRKDEPAPLGWAQDEAGNQTTDPHAPTKGGALLPLGSDYDHGSHKGYCLGAIVDILCGVLSGANFGPWVPPFATAGATSERQPPVGEGTGHFVGAMRIDGFMPAEEFKARMDTWIEAFQNAQAQPGYKVLIPGQPEREMQAERLVNGIPIIDKVVNDLQTLAGKLNVEF